MKQTAVEWYAIESGKLEVERAKGYLTFSQMFDKMLEILKQALEMEKEQIENAFNQGFSTAQWDKSKENKAEQHYNKTFKSE